MAVGASTSEVLHPVPGVRLGAVAAGLKEPDRLDLVLVDLLAGSGCAAVFTRNRFRAAPVRLAESHLAAGGPVRYLLINTANANAGTGGQGMRDALACCTAVAEQGDCSIDAVLPFSTGVIGEPLPAERITQAVPHAFSALAEDGWASAAEGIRTTDTRNKAASERVTIDGHEVTITGIAKGAGMIRPDMATMLAFVATDAGVEPGLLRRLLSAAVNASFNRITVDGDTSTNDACTLIATGASGLWIADRGSPACEVLLSALTRVCTRLAQAIVRDGEGATRFVSVRVSGAVDEGEAERVAFAVAESPLVKTALFAGDPNWGRILAAVGRAGVTNLEVDHVRVWLDDYPIAADGGRVPDYDEAEAAARLAGEEVTVAIDLGRGEAGATVWTCDLSYEYVRINADYRS